MTTELARAKVNLALHITGQRADGYHLLDSIVAFADIGDRLDFFDAGLMSLTVEGPEAVDVPVDMDNSILKALELLGPNLPGIAVLLTKILPVASGIGGGTADAAAALRGAIRQCGISPEWLMRPAEDGEFSQADLDRISEKLLVLGADVPVCMFSQSCRMQGIGEDITPIKLPQLPAVLVNPRVPVPTPKVFGAITQKNNTTLSPIPEDPEEMVMWLSHQRNDMQAAAIELAPEIGDALDALSSQDTCRLARMSGSGATCFGLFHTTEAARAAATTIATDHPEWWVGPCTIG